MKTTDDDNVFYDEDNDEFVLHGNPEGCYGLSGNANIYAVVTQFMIRDLGTLVVCDDEEFANAHA